MTKKAHISWPAVVGADGYTMFVSKGASNNLNPTGDTTSLFTELHNLSLGDVVNFGVQAFQNQTINGAVRRVAGDVTVIQFDVVDIVHVFAGKPTLTLDSIVDE